MRRQCGCLLAGLVMLSSTGMTADHSTRKPNRLVHEKSPYLLQHAYNPVDWFPWGEEAFAKARQENKPIFLSIGYSTCHWCHVMERESFENDAIAALMNAYFICIKLDREERPDIDKIYMTAVQATTGSGGWPMSVWLTPELKPFFCGTYFPPDSRYGRPGFKQLIEKLHEVWESNHDGILAQAKDITATIEQHSGLSGGDKLPDESPLRLGYEQFRGSFDETHGGFGGAPKFPRPVTLNFLFRYFARTGEQKARDMALQTLRAMGEGGMFDQLGGGFHRYSVDERWLVSHFEKMLYDQAQLVSSYIDAYQITRDPFYADIARRTCDYVLRDMTSPDGGFYSAEDADSEGVEGKFYVWTREEVEQVLAVGGSGIPAATPQTPSTTRRDKNVAPTSPTEPADLFCRAYDVDRPGNWEHGLNVLHVAMHPLPDLADSRQKLFAVREKRVRPHRDEKILTSWNGLMISALCRAAQALDEPRYRQAAERAAGFIRSRHYRAGKLSRTETAPAVVDDYAFFANGLVDLYETTFEPQWLMKARELADTMIELFYDRERGGFFMTDGRDPSVIVRAKEDYDGAEPSGNSMAALLLLRLAEFTGDSVAAVGDRGGEGGRAQRARLQYREIAEKTLAAFTTHLNRAPHAVPQMLCALDFALGKPKQIVLAGARDAEETRAMIRAVHQTFLPNKVLLFAEDGGKFAQALKPIDGKTTAYVCENFTCQLPTTDLQQFKTLLR